MNKHILALAALLLATGAQAQNLIVNGDFESNNAGYGGYLYASNPASQELPQEVDATGWIFAANTGTGLINTNWWIWGGMAGSSSVAFLQDHPLFGGAAPVLAQYFSSNATSFEVSFTLGQRPGNSQDVVVMLDGVQLAAPIVADSNGGHYSFTVSGLTGGLHALVFTSDLSPGDQSAFVDNVSVVALAPVPEPASFGLMGLGLLGMGLMRRRRVQA